MKQAGFICCAVAITIALLSCNNNPGNLNPVAQILFKDVKSKLTDTEKNQIADSLKFTIVGVDILVPFALAEDSSSFEYPFGALVNPIDLNNDGIEEVFISYGNIYTSGNTGSEIVLFIKDKNGIYLKNLGFAGLLPDVLEMKTNGFPDLLIGVPGSEYPIHRWNGVNYAFHRVIKDAKYKSTSKVNVETLSVKYREKLTSKD